MASAKSLSHAEVSLIKGMLCLIPRLTGQQILAYFTRPGRDLNHRVIGEIERGEIFSSIGTAQITEVRRFMYAYCLVHFPNPTLYGLLPGGHPKTQQGRRELFLDWWPVGQGLFSSGAILVDGAPRFNWIYDCGTSSKDSLLEDAIRSCNSQRSNLGFSSLDLGILSHFDHDHISGFSRLVQTSRIEVVLLPYLTPLQRLVLALEQGLSSEDAEFGFYVDPVNYLRGLDGSDIGEVVFVQPSGPDDEPPAPPIEPGPDPEGTEGPRIKFAYDKPPAEAQGEIFIGQPDAKVSYLRKGGDITIPFFWEFLPYNDASMLPKVTKDFQDAATDLVEDIQQSPNTRSATLVKLKNLYDRSFGKSSENRNIISLFVYSGPVDQSATLLDSWSCCSLSPVIEGKRFAQMYTGDGILNTQKQFDKFKNYFLPGSRLSRAGIFQVMHHGARGSWRAGLAASLKPEVSIFSSDPFHKTYKHPHSDVLRDFWTFNPVQVDTSCGFHMRGIF